MTDHATKPSERILDRARALSDDWSSEQPSKRYTLLALLEYLDEQAASANPAPIEPTRLLFERINQAWRKHPQLRLGQLICNALLPGSGAETAPLFYADDGAFVAAIEAYKWPTKVAGSPSGEAAAPSPVEPKHCSTVWCNRGEHAGAGCSSEPEQAPQAERFGPPDGVFASESGDAPQAEATPPEPPCGGLTGAEWQRREEGIIRAAEGVTLEPGEYEVVAIAARDEEPGLTIGQRFTLRYSLDPLSWTGERIWGTRHTLLTAVRRVVPAPLTEPEPVPESGSQCERCGETRTTCARGKQCDERTLARIVDLTIRHERDQRMLAWRQARIDELSAEHVRDQLLIGLGKGRIENVTKERDELRSKVSELEAKVERLDGAQHDCGGLQIRCDGLHSTLTATEAKLATAVSDCEFVTDSLAAATRNGQTLSAELARVRGELAEERDSNVMPRSTGARMIAKERERQVSEEQWDAAHDDEHDRGELGRAAACYAMGEAAFRLERNGSHVTYVEAWPWDGEWDKHGDSTRIRDLEKAGALCAAEIDRLLRALPESAPETVGPLPTPETPAVAAPAVVQREIVAGAMWRGKHGDELRVTHVTAESVDYLYDGPRVRGGGTYSRHVFTAHYTWVSDPPAPPTAIPRGTTLEVGRWYRITEISRDDPRPAHRVGDVLQCVLRSDFGMPLGTVSAEPISIGGSTRWFAKAIDGGTYVTGLELVPGPVTQQKEGA